MSYPFNGISVEHNIIRSHLFDFFAVEISACAFNVSLNQGDVILFPHIISSSGIHNTSMFINTGTFTCERPGLYFISCFVMSYSQFASFSILKNNKEVSHVYVNGGTAAFQRSDYSTGTSVQVISLDVGDTIVVETAYPMYVYGHPYSCLTIFKLKW